MSIRHGVYIQEEATAVQVPKTGKYWAGASIEYKSDDNPKTAILAGTMKFRQHIAPYTPAQEIVDIIDYDTDTLAAAVGGN